MSSLVVPVCQTPNGAPFRAPQAVPKYRHCRRRHWSCRANRPQPSPGRTGPSGRLALYQPLPVPPRKGPSRQPLGDPEVQGSRKDDGHDQQEQDWDDWIPKQLRHPWKRRPVICVGSMAMRWCFSPGAAGVTAAACAAQETSSKESVASRATPWTITLQPARAEAS